jgi:hypothetical protein
VASGALVLLRRSSRAAHTECCVGYRGSVVGQVRIEVMTCCNLWMASSLVPCVQDVSCGNFKGKLGAIGSCGRRGQCQSFGPVQPTRMALPS